MEMIIDTLVAQLAKKCREENGKFQKEANKIKCCGVVSQKYEGVVCTYQGAQMSIYKDGKVISKGYKCNYKKEQKKDINV